LQYKPVWLKNVSTELVLIKKRRNNKKSKEAEPKPRRKKSKEVDGKQTKAIDVENFLSMRTKTSVQTKTSDGINDRGAKKFHNWNSGKSFAGTSKERIA
jgi:hypothetical protein